jgi:hypothetical protein
LRPRAHRHELQAQLPRRAAGLRLCDLRRGSLARAWPIKFVAGKWDNESDENVIEHVPLTYEYFELVR